MRTVTRLTNRLLPVRTCFTIQWLEVMYATATALFKLFEPYWQFLLFGILKLILFWSKTFHGAVLYEKRVVVSKWHTAFLWLLYCCYWLLHWMVAILWIAISHQQVRWCRYVPVLRFNLWITTPRYIAITVCLIVFVGQFPSHSRTNLVFIKNKYCSVTWILFKLCLPSFDIHFTF